MKKRVGIIVLSIAVICAMASLAGCSKSDDGAKETKEKKTVTANKDATDTAKKESADDPTVVAKDSADSTEDVAKASQDETSKDAATNKSSKPSSSSSTSGSSTSKPSSSGSSKPASSSSSSSKPSSSYSGSTSSGKTEPTHTHVWKPVYKTVHHDAVYKTVTKEVPVYETKTMFNWCKECGKCVNLSTHQVPTEVGGEGYTDHHTTYHKVTTQTGTKTETERVLVKEAYDEQVIDHYECSCGARK